MSIVTRTRDTVADTPSIGVADEVERWLRLRSLVAAELVPQPGRADVETAAAAFARIAPAACSGLASGQQTFARGGFGLQLLEGRTFTLDLSPGAVRIRMSDENRRDRTRQRAEDVLRTLADVQASYLSRAAQAAASGLPDRIAVDGVIPERTPSRVITEWSKRSRARMFQSVAMLDLSEFVDLPGDCAMVTLTLPGNWLAVAPTGRAFKRLVDRFRKRWLRAGLSWVTLWKLEFQRRGAPHMHMLMKVPALVGSERFEDWLSRTWAEVVGADDTACHGGNGLTRHGVPVTPWHSEGLTDCSCTGSRRDTERARHLRGGTGVDFDMSKMSDPRRIAVYFLGHSSKHTDGKEYQHVVPDAWQGVEAGPGRFWGYTGVKKAVVGVQVEARAYVQLQRVLRKVARARTWQRWAERGRHGLDTPRNPCRHRCICSTLHVSRLWSFGSAGGWGGGTVVVNDALALGYDLARYLGGADLTEPTRPRPEPLLRC